MRLMILLVGLLLSIIFLVLPCVIGILLQKKITKSNKTVVLKSIGNVIIMTALQLLNGGRLYLDNRNNRPGNRSRCGGIVWNLFIYGISICNAANIITVVITHFLAKK
ncbi:hypothetical protein R4Z09_29265 [Niallia oryzisoli]|uniref:Uncharacterized protein n=1 Tax=Niallia oryzisoli TaxID=1737571 RepID=A0ABZ2CDV3_9BACI